MRDGQEFPPSSLPLKIRAADGREMSGDGDVGFFRSMDSFFLLTTGLGAALTVYAFLGLLSNASIRKAQESSLKAFLRAREAHRGKRCAIWKRRRERIADIRATFEARKGSGEAAVARNASEGPSDGKGADPAKGNGRDALNSELAGLAKRVKDRPEAAASVLKLFLHGTKPPASP